MSNCVRCGLKYPYHHWELCAECVKQLYEPCKGCHEYHPKPGDCNPLRKTPLYSPKPDMGVPLSQHDLIQQSFERFNHGE